MKNNSQLQLEELFYDGTKIKIASIVNGYVSIIDYVSNNVENNISIKAFIYLLDKNTNSELLNKLRPIYPEYFL